MSETTQKERPYPTPDQELEIARLNRKLVILHLEIYNTREEFFTLLYSLGYTEPEMAHAMNANMSAVRQIRRRKNLPAHNYEKKRDWV